MINYLFVCSRTTYEIAKTKNIIGFHDQTNSLNNVFSKMEKGDRIFFYITKEKVVDGYAIVSEEMYLDDKKIYDNLNDLCVRRIGVKVHKANKTNFIPLIDQLSFIKKKKGVVWSAYLVKNLIILNEKDTITLEKAVIK